MEGNEDHDFDGIPNFLDIDSDNDGILDAIEAVASITNQTVTTSSNQLTTALITTTPVDTDADGHTDMCDIDSDDDGIPDNIEGQSDGAYIPPSGVDTDGDGLDDAYDTDNGGTPLPTPNDADGDSAPDFRDNDSDNDGLQDGQEVGAGLASGIDSDNDGLDDAYDILANGPGVNSADNVTASLAQYTDEDQDGIPDYRDTASINDCTQNSVMETQLAIDGASVRLTLKAQKVVNNANSYGCSNAQQRTINRLTDRINEIHELLWRDVWLVIPENYFVCSTTIPDQCSVFDVDTQVRNIRRSSRRMSRQIKRIARRSCIPEGVSRSLTRSASRARKLTRRRVQDLPNPFIQCDG